ncbi:MAG: GNAT family N-acetyltransferase [Ardenticatenaceae bacterium]|nr:GNAT family N-acetyltransferase [Anaerolineales bacterium]MCB8923277.1 GNAT family N-acetyltransferase [Ardenticatenaceae bacterium]
MQIGIESIDSPDVQALLMAHLESMHQYSPVESIHALTTAQLGDPSITLWCAREEQALLGCGALKMLDEFHGEIKSMRTAPEHLRKGIAQALLEVIIQAARERSLVRVSLETGSHEAFRPARELYMKNGFCVCGPFPPYLEDPYSVFMSLKL